MHQISAFALAGGKSSRMGADKALLQFDGLSLLARALALLRTLTPLTYIVGDRIKFGALGQVVEDIYAGCGPLAGIHAALLHTATDRNLLLAVDLPFVTPALLQFLVSRSQKTGSAVTVTRVGGRIQPLCAIYRKHLAGDAESALRKGEYKVEALFHGPHTDVIEESELMASGFSPSMFENVNTPSDWESAISRWSKRL